MVAINISANERITSSLRLDHFLACKDHVVGDVLSSWTEDMQMLSQLSKHEIS